jgi:hypothetical protein
MMYGTVRFRRHHVSSIKAYKMAFKEMRGNAADHHFDTLGDFQIKFLMSDHGISFVKFRELACPFVHMN